MFPTPDLLYLILILIFHYAWLKMSVNAYQVHYKNIYLFIYLGFTAQVLKVCILKQCLKQYVCCRHWHLWDQKSLL